MFSKKINKFVQNVKDDMNDTHRRTALDVFAKVVKRTPVGNPDLWKSKPPPGYVGGHARANWQMSINTIPRSEIDGTTPPRAANVARANINDKIYIVNNAPYIQALEHGHSSQAPSGMVKVTVSEFKSIVHGNV